MTAKYTGLPPVEPKPKRRPNVTVSEHAVAVCVSLGVAAVMVLVAMAALLSGSHSAVLQRKLDAYRDRGELVDPGVLPGAKRGGWRVYATAERPYASSPLPSVGRVVDGQEVCVSEPADGGALVVSFAPCAAGVALAGSDEDVAREVAATLAYRATRGQVASRGNPVKVQLAALEMAAAELEEEGLSFDFQPKVAGGAPVEEFAVSYGDARMCWRQAAPAPLIRPCAD